MAFAVGISDGVATSLCVKVSALVVDTTSGPEDSVYVGWTGTRRDRNKPLMAVSRDSGRSWSEPIDLTGVHFEDETVRQAMA